MVPGACAARYDYDVWGNRTKLSGDLECEIGFTGYWNHAPSGLYLSPTRAYSSALGRFISRDPLGEKGGLNLYGYVGNDPVNEVDSTGLYVTYSPGDYTNWNAQFANYWKNSGAFREKWHRMQVSPYYFNFTPDGSPLTPSTISGSGNLRVDDDGSGPSHDDPNHQTSTSCRRHGRSLNADRDSYYCSAR
jgi:RHS repeat-associated protein